MLSAILALTGLGLIAALGLGLAAKRFAVEVDPKVERLNEILPGVNCGGCGYPGCSGFAEALAKGEAEINQCAVGGPELTKEIAEILGMDYEEMERRVAVIYCQGAFSRAKRKFEYHGVRTCRAAQLVAGGDKECQYGCLGFGDCVRACPFGAAEIKDGLSTVNEDLCTACGNCMRACPRDIIRIVPVSKKVHVLCCSHDKGGVVRKICSVGCIGCKKCVKECPFGAIDFENFKATINIEKCTNCGLCATVCPTGAIVDSCEVHLLARIDAALCNGCGDCVEPCPVKAISGEPGRPHSVDLEKCISCGVCVDLCGQKAIALSQPRPEPKPNAEQPAAEAAEEEGAPA